MATKRDCSAHREALIAGTFNQGNFLAARVVFWVDT